MERFFEFQRYVYIYKILCFFYIKTAYFLLVYNFI